jgi:DNA-binding GntR family transcriptional regulator
MSKISQPRNLSRTVLAAVRAEVLSGRLPPGHRLSPRALATQHEVSLSVVREALTRLSEQGLVVAEPQLGFSVVELDLDDMRDLYQLRALIEGTALRDAIERGDLEYETRVIASHHRLERTPHLVADGSGQVTEDWSAAHAQFHYELLSASTSPRLRDLADRLRDTSELYRSWSGTLVQQMPPRDIAAEHRALMQAVLDHDADRGVALITEHINLTATLLEDSAADQLGDDKPGARMAS